MVWTENAIPVLGTAGANYTGAATTSDIVSLKNYNRLAVVINCYAWAGGTAAVTIKQCTAVAGTGAKALAFTNQKTNVADTSTPVLTDTTVTSNTFDLSAANAKHIIEIKSEDLDIDNGFDCVRCDVASPGANNDFYSVEFWLYNGDSVSKSPIVD